MKKYFIYVATAVVAVSTMFYVTVPVMVQADAVTDICAGVEVGSGGACSDPNSGSRVGDVVKLAINIFSIIAGIISLAMLIIGGLKFITSQGESANIASARATILYAIVGIVVVALSQFVIRFVLSKV